MNKFTFPLMAIALTSSVSCTNMSNQEQGTFTGAGIGALVGGGIAAVTGGDGWTGAAIGAVAGGIAGNIRGREED